MTSHILAQGAAARRWRTLAACAALLNLAACGGGGGGADAPGPAAAPAAPAPAPAPATPAPSPVPAAPPPAPGVSPLDVSADYREGTTLEYTVRTSTADASPSGTSASTAGMRVRLVLGAATVMQGLTVHPVAATAFTPLSGWQAHTFAWKYLGRDGLRLVGSRDGIQVVTLYGDQGRSVSGLFNTFSPSVPGTVIPASFSAEGGVAVPGVVAVSYGRTSGGCEIVLDMTFCQDSSNSFSQTEYFKNGWGVVGARKSIRSSFSGGGFLSAHTSSSEVELVATSLTAGDGTTLPAVWSTAAPLPQAVSVAAATAHSGKLWLASGGSGGTAAAGLYTFDPTSGQLQRRSDATCPQGRLVGHGNGLVCLRMAQKAVRIDTTTGASQTDAAAAPGPWATIITGTTLNTWGAASGSVGSAIRTYLAISDQDSLVNGVLRFRTKVWEYANGSYTLRADLLSQQRISALEVVDGRLYLVGTTLAPATSGGDPDDDAQYATGITECTLPELACTRLVVDATRTDEKSRYGFPRLRGSANLVAIGRRLVSFGDGSHVSLLDLDTKTARTVRPMLAPRQNWGIAAVGGRAYAVGGLEGGNGLMGVEVFQP